MDKISHNDNKQRPVGADTNAKSPKVQARNRRIIAWIWGGLGQVGVIYVFCYFYSCI